MGIPEDIDRGRVDQITYTNNRLSYRVGDEEKHTRIVPDPIEIPQDESDEEGAEWKPGVREWLVIVCTSMLAMMDAVNATIIVPLIPDLAELFDKPLSATLWTSSGYLLANAASQLIFALLSDIVGHGILLLIAVVISTVGTGVCGGSTNLPTLIAGRSVQGIGGGGAMAISIITLVNAIPERQRGQFSGYMLVVWVIGAALGPFVGAIFSDYFQWNWGFYLSLAFCALGLLVIPFANDLRFQKRDCLYKLRMADWFGAVLTVVGISCALVAASFGGIVYSWDDWQIAILFAVGGCAMIVLTVYEILWASQPLFSSKVFKSSSSVMAFIGSLLQGLLMCCQLQYLDLYLDCVKDIPPTLTAVGLVAITGLALPTFLLSNKFLNTLRRSPWVIRAGWILNILAAALLIVVNSETPTVGWIFIFFAAGMGHGLLISGYNTYIQASSIGPDDEESEKASASAMTMYFFLRTLGMSIAIPVGGAMLLNQLHGDIISTSDGDSLNFRKDLIPMAGVNDLHFIRVAGFRVVWQVFTGVTASGGILSCFISSKKDR